MGIDFSNTSMLSFLAAPVQSLTAWFLPARNAARPLHTATKPQQLVLPFTPFTAGAVAPGDAGGAIGTSGKSGAKSSLRSQLRVVREFDLAVGPSCAGRMVISGRMADVCAELERMSQGEASTR